MSIKEYKQILEDELKEGKTMDSSLKILEAKRKLLETNNSEIVEVLTSLEGRTIEDTILMLNDYLGVQKEGTSSSKGNSMTLSNPDYKSFLLGNENDTGFSNIILLSIALIIIVIIIFVIILV